MKIEHQLLSKDFFLPKWPIKHLFLGTFNPEGGKPVNYFYGRVNVKGNGNQTWPLLSKVFRTQLDVNNPDTFFDEIKMHGIACMDMIQEVDAPIELEEYINGKGYNDKKIINNLVTRKYNTQNILKVIEANPNVKVYTTWGMANHIREWQLEVAKIPDLNTLVSPSMAARVPKGTKKFDYMLNDWESKIV